MWRGVDGRDKPGHDVVDLRETSLYRTRDPDLLPARGEKE
jgi:hypothetical protein